MKNNYYYITKYRLCLIAIFQYLFQFSIFIIGYVGYYVCLTVTFLIILWYSSVLHIIFLLFKLLFKIIYFLSIYCLKIYNNNISIKSLSICLTFPSDYYTADVLLRNGFYYVSTTFFIKICFLLSLLITNCCAAAAFYDKGHDTVQLHSQLFITHTNNHSYTMLSLYGKFIEIKIRNTTHLTVMVRNNNVCNVPVFTYNFSHNCPSHSYGILHVHCSWSQTYYQK